MQRVVTRTFSGALIENCGGVSHTTSAGQKWCEVVRDLMQLQNSIMVAPRQESIVLGVRFNNHDHNVDSWGRVQYSALGEVS